MDLDKLIGDYLSKSKMMQVATSIGNQPWVCTLYYVSDENKNIYWISKPDTRHSKEIIKNSKVAVAVPVVFTDSIVIGLQIEGDARIVEDLDEIKKSVKLYSDKFKRGEDWCRDFIKGKNPHKLYRITPRSFVLFDPENFPDKERQEIKV